MKDIIKNNFSAFCQAFKSPLLNNDVVCKPFQLKYTFIPILLLVGCFFFNIDIAAENYVKYDMPGSLTYYFNIITRFGLAIYLLIPLGIIVLARLFIDADKKQIDAAIASKAPYIEIHTGHYADAENEQAQKIELIRLIEGIKYAHANGLKVNAGHGLNYFNVKSIAAIEEITELNIGHAIIARAVIDGLDKAVRDMKQLMLEARS